MESEDNKQKKSRIFLSPRKLASRWCMSADTLCQWRWNGKTPLYHKFGKKILYDLEEIERFEDRHIRRNTSQQGNVEGPANEEGQKRKLVPRVIEGESFDLHKVRQFLF